MDRTEILDTGNNNSRELLDVLEAQGLKTIVLSPGSRNTPLLIGAQAREGLRKIIMTDERTAAFVALGIGMVTRTPVALACTSGTALYNYAPAIAEAYYQKIPLIVITADRPAQWIDQDDSQTLRQAGALDGIVKKSYDIPSETGMSSPCKNPEYKTEREWYVNRIANEAFLTATTGTPGPVHINMQFGNPLNTLVAKDTYRPRTIKVIRNESGLSPHQLREICETLMNKRIMVTAGFLAPDNRLNRAVMTFCRFPNVTIICETISNLRPEGDPYMADSLLTRISKEKLRELRPDIVISIGGALVSRMLKEYLRESKETEHWTLADTDVSVDCFQRLTTHIDIDASSFFYGAASVIRHMLRKGKNITFDSYAQAWRAERERIKAENHIRMTQVGWSELLALDEVFRTIPREFNLFLSNGTCIRYGQLLMDQLPHACYSNRGVSGIDGTNATALGVAMAYNGPTLLVTGDMSFAYCPEVMNYMNSGADLRIIVINNGGGGIFRFIKTTRELTMRDEYFCCDKPLPIEGLAKAYGWTYCKAKDMASLRKALRKLYAIESTIIEIEVEPDSSARELVNWIENLK